MFTANQWPDTENTAVTKTKSYIPQVQAAAYKRTSKYMLSCQVVVSAMRATKAGPEGVSLGRMFAVGRSAWWHFRRDQNEEQE